MAYDVVLQFKQAAFYRVVPEQQPIDWIQWRRLNEADDTTGAEHAVHLGDGTWPIIDVM